MAKQIHQQISGPVGVLEVIEESALASGPLAPSGLFAVIAHPHPLYGGSMDNKVVTTLVRTFRELGVASARFNFRGVGQSAGTHAQGVGEVEDLRAVVDWMQGRYPDGRVILAGFSFGAAMALELSALQCPGHLLLVAPPVGRNLFDENLDLPCPTTIVLGGQDDIVDKDRAQVWVERQDTAVETLVLEKATHFFHGQLIELRQRLGVSICGALG